MIRRPKLVKLVPMLVLGATLTVAAALAQSVSGTIRIDLDRSPRWSEVSGTRVYVIDDPDRPDYDMFRYDNRYYVYRDDRWYTSNQWRGSFMYVDPHSLPEALMRVPRERWVRYPSDWAERDDRYDRDGRDYRYDRSDRGSHRTSGTLRVSLGSRPRWSAVPGTRVYVIRTTGRRPAYDIFRFGDVFYVYDSERWYSSSRWNGTFTHIDGRAVPRELARVPRRHWRHYPQAWANEYRDRRYDRDDRRYDRDGRRY